VSSFIISKKSRPDDECWLCGKKEGVSICDIIYYDDDVVVSREKALCPECAKKIKSGKIKGIYTRDRIFGKKEENPK